MYYIQPKPNPSGAYSAPMTKPFPNAIEITDEQLSMFLEYNGFVKFENGVMVANEDARNIWLAETQSDAQETEEAVALSAEAPASSTKERIAKLEQELTQLKAELK